MHWQTRVRRFGVRERKDTAFAVDDPRPIPEDTHDPLATSSARAFRRHVAVVTYPGPSQRPDPPRTMVLIPVTLSAMPNTTGCVVILGVNNNGTFDRFCNLTCTRLCNVNPSCLALLLA